MNSHHLIVSICLLILSSCQPISEPQKQDISRQAPLSQTAITVTIHINSLQDLTSFFNRVNYGTNAWQFGSRTVPRLTFSTIPKEWQYTDKEMAAEQKTTIFFKLLLPLILIANEEVDDEYHFARNASLQNIRLITLAKKYQILPNDSSAMTLTPKEHQQLMRRIGHVPPSLALAQAAKESGWAISRFSTEKHAYFGRVGVVPKRTLSGHALKRNSESNMTVFNTPLAAVKQYVLNVNTQPNYSEFRAKRLRLNKQGRPVTGLALASTLKGFAKQGEVYVDTIKSLIRFYQLEDTDEGYLVGIDTYQLTYNPRTKLGIIEPE